MMQRRRFLSSALRRGVQALALGLAVTVVTPGCGDGDAHDYDLEIAIGSSELISALQFDITHLGESGGFLGHGDRVDCTVQLDAIVAANYRGDRDLSVGMVSLAGFVTPAVILQCGFRTREDLNPASFQIAVTDASGPDGEPLDPPPVVSITGISRR